MKVFLRESSVVSFDIIDEKKIFYEISFLKDGLIRSQILFEA
jgi:hypothetical protein